MTDFKLEKELKPLVDSWLSSKGFIVKHEVATIEGVCDILACHFEQPSLNNRFKYGIKEHLTNDVQLTICILLKDAKNKITPEILFDFFADKFEKNSDDISKEIKKLIQKNAIYQNDAYLNLVDGWFPMRCDLIAIELKLNNFREALAQARRYSEYSNYSYVALPKDSISKISGENIDIFKKEGIGLLSVSSNSVEIIISSKFFQPRNPFQTLEMLRLTELFWKMFKDNSSSIV